ncbi:MAG: helix-turn-helix transcriptional regulator [Eubacteriales bacterium]
MISNRIVFLREKKNLTQSALAKILGITRSSVNAWEMGISVPSTQYIVELSEYFSVSTDYLLGVNKTVTLDISGLNDSDIEILHQLTQHLKEKNRVEKF